MSKRKGYSEESIRKRVETRKRRGTNKHTEETKKKISESCKGRSPWNKGLDRGPNSGKKFTQEHKDKISASSIGKPGTRTGFRKYTHEDIVEKLKIINPDIKLLGTYNGITDHIDILCLKCNHIWAPEVGRLLTGKGCPKCKASKGEKLIQRYLESHNINFEIEKTFPTCIYKKKLRFDFYIPLTNTCIEYDGILHFKTNPKWGGDKGLEESKKRDEIKNVFCKENDISLIRIDYLHKNEIDKILDERLI